MQHILYRTLQITISHPHGNPNSYQAARAFADANWLRSFQRGASNNGLIRHATKFNRTTRERLPNRNFDDIPSAMQHGHFMWEAISRFGSRLKPAGLTPALNWYDVLFCGHDLQVSGQLGHDLNAVYAYEDGAMWTFAAAKKRGARTVYELPLGYYLGVARELKRAQAARPNLLLDVRAEPDWKRRRKEKELSLSDLVVVPCRWAEESLPDKETARTLVLRIPYGTPADEIEARSEHQTGPFTVLFAGQVGLRKGVPLLLEAWRRLGLKDARLWLAGSMNLGNAYLAEYAGCFEYLGALPKAQLLERMRQADLFVFPSLAEGFGLVIGEAMAAGVPVLTTHNTGGPELITDGVEGWCVAAHDVDELAARLEWAARRRDELWEMGCRARRRAESWTWTHYRQHLIAELAAHLI
ncbi:MAG: glycosyltransferase family 4 protein [Pyrinomonadaceae bacterium]